MRCSGIQTAWEWSLPRQGSTWQRSILDRFKPTFSRRPIKKGIMSKTSRDGCLIRIRLLRKSSRQWWRTSAKSIFQAGWTASANSTSSSHPWLNEQAGALSIKNDRLSKKGTESSVSRLKRKLESVIDPDEFVEIAKEIGIENLTEQQQNYYLYPINRKKQSGIMGRINRGIEEGISSG